MKKNRFVLTAACAAPVLLLGLTWRGAAQSSQQKQISLVLGQQLVGLTDSQEEAFGEGVKAFAKTDTLKEGLGPVFNGTSCSECHKAGAIGGAGIDLATSRVTRIGAVKNGVYSDLPELGGPVLQARSIAEFDTSCPIVGEVVPPQANCVSLRITTPLFGAGLIEAIPEETILARVGKIDSDGIHGEANRVHNFETGKMEVGRFGWKAQHSSLHLFAGDAYLNEMGVTSTLFPNENLPQGQPFSPYWQFGSTPNDTEGEVEKFTTFMRLLAPAGRRLPVTTQMTFGGNVFKSIRCGACHVPQMNTGANLITALSHQPVKLYSDLLLHQMGDGLADGIRQGNARGDQFRTAPLWGLSRRMFFMHDGRANTIEGAILSHGGEANPVVKRYLNLNSTNRAALMAFLNSL